MAKKTPDNATPDGEYKIPHVRASKAKAKDFTDPYRHGYKARGGPIERILPAERKSPEPPPDGAY